MPNIKASPFSTSLRAALVLLPFLCAPAWSQQTLDPDVTQYTLANGLTVWVVARDGMPRVDYVLAFKNAGLAADDATRPGFASTVAGLLSEGSQQRASTAIAETAQSYGGGVAAFASNDGLIVSADALASNAGPMLGLLAEIVRQPSFPEQEIALAKANALQGLKAAEAQPGFRAERAILKAVYGEHPYARTQTTEAGINAITRDALVAAAECVTMVERYCSQRTALVGTGGRMTVKPGAVNVIPGIAEFTLDIRSPDDALRDHLVPLNRKHPIDELLATCETISVHVDGRASNKNLFGQAEFAAMRPRAMFLNLSRGFVVDTSALADALRSGHLAGAGVDVFQTEPKSAGDPFGNDLQGLPNVILTPHVGGSTLEAQVDIGRFTAGKLIDFMAGGSTVMRVNLPQVPVSYTHLTLPTLYSV